MTVEKSNNEIRQVQERIVSDFALFDDWMDRYQYIIDLGRQATEFPEEWKVRENLLEGCQSQVWIVSEVVDKRLHYYASSDSAIVAGLIAILLSVYSGQTAADIASTPPEFIEKIKLGDHLSPTRSNGLHAMINHIRQRAIEVLAKDT